MPGKLIILMIKKTRDEAYHWAAFHKEKKMYRALDSIKNDLENKNSDFSDNKNHNNKDKQETLF